MPPACRHDDGMSESFPRVLTTVERAVLEVLLAGDFDGAERLRLQAQSVMVSGECGCGCPSIYFRRLAEPGGIALVAEADVPTQDQSVLLFVAADGGLDSLELQWTTEHQPTEWPEPASLRARSR